jgi:hypothetical protein
LAQQKQSRKVGRPKLPKGEAKGRIVPVRFTPNELRAMGLSARLRKESISEWLRRVLPREAKHKGYNIQLTTRPAKPDGFTTFGWITNELVETEPIPAVPPGAYPTKEAALQAGMAWCKGRIDLGSMNDAKLQA